MELYEDVMMCYMVAKMEVYQKHVWHAGLIIPRNMRPSTKSCKIEVV